MPENQLDSLPRTLTNCYVVGGPAEPQDITWVGDTITEMRPSTTSQANQEDPSAGSKVIDAQGGYVMPGLIDCHVHLILDSAADIVDYVYTHDDAKLAEVAARNATRTLRGGVTTARDLGCCDFAVPRLRDRLRPSDLQGPRLVAAGQMISAPGGHVRRIAREIEDKPGGASEAVREQVEAGVDWVKLILSGGLLTKGTDPSKRDVLSALATEVGHAAKEAGLPLAVHAYHDEHIREGLDAGARSIEHGSWASPQVLAQIRDSGAFLVPTLAAARRLLDNPSRMADHALRNAEAAWESATSVIPLAREAGVPIAMGTDAGTPFNRHGENWRELQLLVDCGLTNAEAIACATTVAAELLGIEDSVGEVRVGAMADLLVVGANPLQKLDTLGDPLAVVTRGSVLRTATH